MENHTSISAKFELEGNLVEKRHDFWDKLYNNPIRLYVIGPMEIISFIVFVPALLGIFVYIGERPVKYEKTFFFCMYKDFFLYSIILKITGQF